MTIRSNVFIRHPGSVKEDNKFIKQVRGKTALTKLIAQFPELESSAHGTKLLDQRQVAELVWETPCTKCGAIPEGQIWSKGRLEIAFRCPLAVCAVSSHRARTVSLDPNIVRKVTSAFGLSLSEVVDVALTSMGDTVSSTAGIACSRRPFTVRLSPSQYHFLSDTDIEAALAALIAE